MRVLILHMRYAPDATGTGPLVTQLARDLHASGDQVTVVTTVPHYGGTRPAVGYGWRLLGEEDDDGIRVLRTAALLFLSNTRLGRLADYLVYTLLAIWGGWRAGDLDVILAVAPPITVAIPAALLGWLRRVPFAFNAQDIWPDGLVEMGKLSEGPWLAPLRWFEAWVYRQAAIVSVVSEGMKQRLVEKSVPAEGLAVIPNWVDLDRIRPVAEGLSFRRKFGYADEFLVLFAGNIGFAAGLEAALSAADQLDEDSKVRFVFVGEGSAKGELQANAEELRLDNVRFLSTQPAEDVADMLSSANVGLVTLRPGMGRLSVPSKTFAYMAAACPVLAAVPPDSEIADVLRASGAGVVVPAADPAALAGAAQELAAADREQLRLMGENGRVYVERRHRRAHLTSEHRQLLASLLPNA